MENNILKSIPDLLDLLETTDYENLTGELKAIILKHWTKEEYDRYRESVRSGKAIFETERKEIKARPEIKERLLKTIEPAKPVGTSSVLAVFGKFFTFRVPAYQPGFAIVLLVFLFVIFQNRTPETIRYLSRVDTVYIEKGTGPVVPEPEARPVEKSTIQDKRSGNPQMGEAMKVISSRDTESGPAIELQNVYHKISLVKRMPSGSSASNDSALLKFLVSAN